MPVIVSTPPPQAYPNSFIVSTRANPVSSVDMFAATRMYHRGRRGLLRRRRVPNMTDLNANLVVYTPLMKSAADVNIISKATDPDDLPDWQRRFVQGGAAAGLLAAPVATLSALRSARKNEGGAPRDALRAIAGSKRLRSPAVKDRAGKLVAILDAPATRKAKLAALAAGAAGVGLQGVATGSDLLVTHMMSGKKEAKS